MMERNIDWQNTIKEFSRPSKEFRHAIDDLSTIHIQDNASSLLSEDPVVTTVPEKESVKDTYLEGISNLTNGQCRAFGIMDRHLQLNMEGKDPTQLQMLMVGLGGVGKSRVINMATSLFKHRECIHKLAKMAMTGIAASSIGGYTLHWWGALPIYMPSSPEYHKEPSRKAKKRREENMKAVEHLFLDEISMGIKHIIGLLSGIAGVTKSGDSSRTLPFGGKLNVILVGNSHQFPPPKHALSALYRMPPANTYWGGIGQNVFHQFKTVVLLKEQKRIQDRLWQIFWIDHGMGHIQRMILTSFKS
jgi:PIF1-like helicase